MRAPEAPEWTALAGQAFSMLLMDLETRFVSRHKRECISFGIDLGIDSLLRRQREYREATEALSSVGVWDPFWIAQP